MAQESRRMKRMSRGKKKLPGMNLVSLMDVFTILVFFLLVNSSNTEELQKPKSLELPESVAEQKPEKAIVIMVTATEITIKGELIALIEDIADDELVITPVQAALVDEANRLLGLNSNAKPKQREVTVMGDRTIPFRLLKKVMASCTAAGYEKISLAVVQKASQNG